MIDTERLVKTFCELVAVDSPSFAERAMADCMTAKLQALGLTPEEDNAAEKLGGSAGNLFVRIPGTLPGTPLLFGAHMDTVEPACGKKAVLHLDGIITSDGSTVLGADDAAGLAVLLEALTSLREDEQPHRALELLITVAEEPYDRGSEVFDFHRLHAKEAYVLDLDGAVGGAAYKAPTICSFTFTVTGRAAHAGFAPESGVHAVAAAALAVSRLKMGHLDAETTLNIGTIQGGTATNIVPGNCVVTGELRSYTHATAQRVLAQVTETFRQAAESYGAELSAESRFGCYAYETPRKARVVQRCAAACTALGLPLQLRETFGGSDANQLAHHGLSVLVLANAMNRVHSCAEYTTAAELTRAAKLVQALAVQPD